MLGACFAPYFNHRLATTVYLRLVADAASTVGHCKNVDSCTDTPVDDNLTPLDPGEAIVV